ncbi:MAG: diaminopimelate decarboxylase [Candidatus Thermofonsia Clade 1 bacterium]|uniref:Diaminopimelate decarboxylase n=1 Tax=Candidatus Thermofonsia Clade 1 bacterium TaxID=2364210 RepID=A0A2M8P0F7_9CHLR|nr:MAG: diaminopimelate decarboxylase [Candidatus Thermofonsia Clade 1 bacterium]
MLSYHNGSLHWRTHDLAAIAAQIGTPCYIYDLDGMCAKLRALQRAFPQAEIHYSLKANANLAVIRALSAAGAHFDAVSGGEIFRALCAGVTPDRIVFAGVGKTRHELDYALRLGVAWVNVESSGELARIAQLAAAIGVRPRLALRLNPDVRADTHPHIATGHAAAKFGIPLDEAAHILNDYAPERAPYRLEGLHVHIGSQLHSVERTVEALQAALALMDRFPFLQTLDLGGGFPVSYIGEDAPSIEAFAAAILPLLEGRPMRLILEPGRYIAAENGLLLVEVQYVKHTNSGTFYIVDGGMTELIRPALYEATHGVLPLRQSNAEATLAHVVGPICESADVLRTHVHLPPLAEGDLLAILHAGAYGAVMGSTYNARPLPPEVVLEGDSWRVARRRQVWDDLVRDEL